MVTAASREKSVKAKKDDKKMEEAFENKTHDRKMRSFVTKAEKICKELKRMHFMFETMILKAPCDDDGDVNRERTELEKFIVHKRSQMFFDGLKETLTKYKTVGTWPYKLSVKRKKKKTDKDHHDDDEGEDEGEDEEDEEEDEVLDEEEEGKEAVEDEVLEEGEGENKAEEEKENERDEDKTQLGKDVQLQNLARQKRQEKQHEKQLKQLLEEQEQNEQVKKDELEQLRQNNEQKRREKLQKKIDEDQVLELRKRLDQLLVQQELLEAQERKAEEKRQKKENKRLEKENKAPLQDNKRPGMQTRFRINAEKTQDRRSTRNK